MTNKAFLKLFSALAVGFDKQFGDSVSPITRAFVICNMITHGVRNGEKGNKAKR